MNIELKRLIQNFWANDFVERIEDLMVDVSLYPLLRMGIPDKYIYLEKAFKENEVEEISEAFKPFFSEYEIVPIIAGYGNQTICVGYGNNNFGIVHYFDFDFGVFNLECSIAKFFESLKTKDKSL